MAEDFFLSRWSRRKAQARRGEPGPEPQPTPTPGSEPQRRPPPAPAAAAGYDAAQRVEGAPAEPVALPPLESLTPDSDFSPFMRPDVDPSLRTQALRTLFQDPRFNVMDGLDVYIDDYSKPDPIPADWMGRLNQMARLGEYREPEPERLQEGEGQGDGAPRHAPAAADPDRPQESAPVPRSDTGAGGDAPTEVDDSSRLADGQ